MVSPSTNRKAGFFGKLFPLRRNFSWGEFRDGSSRRGRARFGSERDDSVGRDSSTTSTAALFDLELSHRSNKSNRGYRLPRVGEEEIPSISLAHGLVQRVSYLSRPTAPFELDLLQDAQALRGVCSGIDGSLDIYQLANELVRMGYACNVQCSEILEESDQVPATVDHSCLSKLRHTYIVCSGRVDGSEVHNCLLDPLFKDQFRIAHSTSSFLELLSLLPLEFVGTQLRLKALADILCTGIAEAYSQQQLPLPPWRKHDAMLSRWVVPELQSPAPALAVLQQESLLPNVGIDGSQNQANTSEAPTGGSAYFYDMLEVHQKSLQRQSLPSNEESNNINTNTEKSNKPRRQQRQLELQISNSVAAVQSGQTPVQLARGYTYLTSIAEASSPPSTTGGLASSITAVSSNSSLAGSAGAGTMHVLQRPERSSPPQHMNGNIASGGGIRSGNGRTISLLAKKLKGFGGRKSDARPG